MNQINKVINTLGISILLFSFSGLATAQSLGTSVKVMVVESQEMTIRREYVGYLKPLERVKIRSEIAGTIENINFEEGKLVKNQQIIAHISTAKSALEVKRAESNYRLAKIRYNTQKWLLEKKIFDRGLEIKLDRSLSQLKQSEADLKTEKMVADKDLTRSKLLLKQQLAQSNLTLMNTNYQTQKKLADKRLSTRQVILKQEQAETNFSLAQSEYDREKSLIEKNFSTKANLDARQNTLENRRISRDLANLERERSKIHTDQVKLESYLNQRETAKVNLELAQLELENSLIKTAQWKLKAFKTKVEKNRLDVEQAQLALEESAGKSDQTKMEPYLNSMEARKVQLDMAQIELEKSKVKAPFTGIVKSKKVQVGGYVKKGEELAEIMDISKVLVRISIPEKDIRFMFTGKKVDMVLDALPEVTLTGKIKTLGLEADTKSRSFPAEIVVDNAAGNLLPGMTANTNLIAYQAKKQILIPSYAVLEREQGKVVFVESKGKARQQYVRLGAVVNDLVQVKSGLKSGDRLIVSGQQFLAHNDRVVVIDSSKRLVQK